MGSFKPQGLISRIFLNDLNRGFRRESIHRLDGIWIPADTLFVCACLAEMPRYETPSGATESSVVWHETLAAGWQESRSRNVPMVIYITSERCTYCDAMKRDTWCDETIRHRLAEGFVAIRLTARRNSATLSRIDVQTYPMTLVGVPEGKIIGHRNGYQPPAALHGLLTEAKRRRPRRDR